MKTLSTFVVNSVSASNDFDGLYDVVFNDGCKASVLALAGNYAIGTLVTKYFGMELTIRPVARNSKGYFLSLKGLEMNLIETVESFINNEEESNITTFIPSVNIDDTVTESVLVSEKVSDKEDTISTKRGKGFNKPSITPVESVVEHKSEDTTFVPQQHNSSYVSLEDELDMINNSQYEQDLNYDMYSLPMDDNTNIYQEVNIDSNIVTKEVTFEDYRKVCGVIWNHFTKKCFLNTMNLNQIKDQLKFSTYNNTFIDDNKEQYRLTVYKDVFVNIKKAFGKRVFVNKILFTEILHTSIAKALETKKANTI